MVARDAYGSRFLPAAPFGYGQEAPGHWYAWDIDSCWMLTVAGAGAFGSAEEALAEWQHAAGPAAGTALSPGAPETTARLLAPCLETGPQWGPPAHPVEGSRYACSPHRIEMAARLIRDGYFPDHANAALRLLPQWTQWCIGQSGLNGDFAARSRAAALTEAAALVDQETHDPAAGQNEAPFRRQE